MVNPTMVYMIYKTIAYLDVSHYSSIAGGLEDGNIRLGKTLGVKFFGVSNQQENVFDLSRYVVHFSPLVK